jgi:hypothetical protein
MKDVYGINTPDVQRFIDRVGKLTEEEIEAAGDRNAAWSAAWSAARNAAWSAAWSAARNAVRIAAWSAARDAVLVAEAIVVIDLITAEQFAILTEPFAEILTELNITWKSPALPE